MRNGVRSHQRWAAASGALLALAGCGGGEPPGLDAGLDAGPPPTPLERLERASEGPAEVQVERGSVRARGRWDARGATREAAARGFLADHGEVFGVDDPADLVFRAIREDADARVVIFDAARGGRPIFGAEARVAFAPEGDLVYVGAILPSGADAPAEPTLDAAAATAAAIAAIEADGATGLVEDRAPRLGVFDPGVMRGAPGAAALAYWVSLRDDEGRRWVALVDAESGAVIERRDGRFEARDRYVGDCGPLDLESCGQPGDHETLCEEDGVVIDASDPRYERATRLFELLGSAHAFWQSTFGRDSFDGEGGRLAVFLRGGIGTIVWDPYQRVIESAYAPLETLSFVVHELTHGVLQVETHVDDGNPLSIHGDWMANDGETGSLGESLADVFGAVATGRWQMTLTDGRVQRDLASPSLTHYRWFEDDAPAQSQGLYDNSGIASLAAYLLAEGGTNPGRPSEPGVRGIGIEKVAAIWYRASTLYLERRSLFSDFRWQALRACDDLIGRHGIVLEDCGELLNAFAAVGVGGWDHDRDLWVDDCTTSATECWLVDNCPPDTTDPALAAAASNPLQEDTDGDRTGDLCEEEVVDAGVPPTDAGAPDADAGGGPTGPCPPAFPADVGDLPLTNVVGPSPHLDVPDQATRVTCNYGTGREHSAFVLEWFHTAGPAWSAACVARAPEGTASLCGDGVQAWARPALPIDGFEDAAELRWLPTLLAIAEAEAIACPAITPDASPCASARLDCPLSHANADGTSYPFSTASETCPVERDPGVFEATCKYVDRSCDDGTHYVPPSPSGGGPGFWYSVMWRESGAGGSFRCVEDRTDRVGATTWESGTHRARVVFYPMERTDAVIEANALALRAQMLGRAEPCPAP